MGEQVADRMEPIPVHGWANEVHLSGSQDLSLSDSTDWSSLGQVSGTLLGTMLPVGLLAGAGALLRIQASRFETEMLDAESLPGGGEDAPA